MTDIVSFLNARLEEDKAAAVRAAAARAGDLTAGSPWHAMGSLLLATQADGVADCIAEIVNYQLDDVLEHIARHSPERVLREVKTKQQIVTICNNMRHGADPDGEVLADETLHELASVYADHPDYDPTWDLASG